MKACPSPSARNTARRSTSSRRTASHVPYVGAPARRSTTTSSTTPEAQLTYLACPGGTSAKWMPRTTPRDETEQFACARARRWPVSFSKRSLANHSRNTPRSSPCCTGTTSKASGTDSSRISTGSGSLGLGDDVEQVLAVPALAQRLGQRPQLVAVDEALAEGDLLDAP